MSTRLLDRPILSFETGQAFHAWLEQNGADSAGIYIRIAKKGSGIPSVTYAMAVEIALCHGWIDGIRRSNDDKTFLQRFTPRKPNSVWSEINRTKVEELMKAKLMRPAGLATVKAAKTNGQWDKAYAPACSIQVPPELDAVLKKNKRARTTFDSLTSGDRFAILHRLRSARKVETRTKRLALYVAMLERGESIHKTDRKDGMSSTDTYLAALPQHQRRALEHLREQILAAVPHIEEGFGYGMPAFKYNGHPLVYIGAAKAHCALYGSVPPGLAAELKDFKTSKGAIQFIPEHPLPAELVKEIVRSKCEMITLRWPIKKRGGPK